MRRRTVGIGFGVLALALVASAVAYRRSGIPAAAAALEGTVRDARAQGFLVNGDQFLAREARHPHYRAKLAYDRALLKFGRQLPKSASAKTMTPTERARWIFEIRKLVPMARSAEGGTGGEWRYGYVLRTTVYRPYRTAVAILWRGAGDARRRGDLNEAISRIEEAEALGNGIYGEHTILSEFVMLGAAAGIGREAASLLGEERLTSAQLVRIGRVLDGPTFRHIDDRRVLEHEAMLGLVSIDLEIRREPVAAVRSRDPLTRIAPLGRIGSVREAWMQSVLRPYVDVAAALPADWTEFERYRSAWKILERVPGKPRDFAEAYSHEIVPLDSVYSDAAIMREAMRRVLLYAVARRLGQAARVPGDPFSDGALKVKSTPDGTLIYSIGRDRKDDGGATLKSPKGDFAVTIPR